jgi:hypothetical protein
VIDGPTPIFRCHDLTGGLTRPRACELIPIEIRRLPLNTCPSLHLLQTFFYAQSKLYPPSIHIHTTTMGYPDTTDAFAVTDIKKWSEFTRKDVSMACGTICSKI